MVANVGGARSRGHCPACSVRAHPHVRARPRARPAAVVVAMALAQTGARISAAPPPPAAETATLAQTPAPRKKRSKIKAATVRSLGTCGNGRSPARSLRANSKVKPSDAHNSYKTWCIENGKQPVSLLTAFGTTMKGAARRGA